MATPLRERVGKQDNVQMLLGEVTNVNPEGKKIVFNDKDIAAIVDGRSRPTFRYIDFGSMAVVHASAVTDLHGFKISGHLGLLLWAIVHLALIPNRKNRITLSIK